MVGLVTIIVIQSAIQLKNLSRFILSIKQTDFNGLVIFSLIKF